MNSQFDKDEHPGRPRILFIGLGESSHTHGWINLLDNSKFNVRLFSMPSGSPPDAWTIKTYVSAYDRRPAASANRAILFDSGKLGRFLGRNLARVSGRSWHTDHLAEQWLGEIIREWRPQVIHTMGLDQARFYFGARKKFGVESSAKWVLQTRGGSDLALSHLDPALQDGIGELLCACDQLLSDNQQNFRIAREFGVREEQISSIGTVPGAGGINTAAANAKAHQPPSSRRLILWPKAYECPWSKALPVFEALKLCWERIEPCELHMFAMCPEARMYYWTLPEYIRRHCQISERLPHGEVLETMGRARVMLAPSLVDGTPNSMFEAMAAGALPIVSPLESICSVVEAETNVLFARNLYPEEIAAALVRAMTDDSLVDEAAKRNLELAGRIANRDEVRARVVQFYESLAGASD